MKKDSKYIPAVLTHFQINVRDCVRVLLFPLD